MEPVCVSSALTEPTHTNSTLKSGRKSRIETLLPSTERNFRDQKTQQIYTLEYSAHICNKRFQRELTFVFPTVNLENCLIVPTFQPCQYDLVAFGDEVAKEKDDKLEYFYDFANRVCKYLHSQGFWADFTDPASGYPIFSERGPSFYPDVMGAEIFLKYELVNTGCCQIMYHPTYGTKCYPATLFTSAPAKELATAINNIVLQE